MGLKLVQGDQEGPRPPESSFKPSRRDILIGTAAAAGGMGVEAVFGPARAIWKLITSPTKDNLAFNALDRAITRVEAEEEAALRQDTNDKALNAATTDPPRPTTSEETFQERMARREREQKAKLKSELEAGINEHIKPEKIAELERRLKAVPKYLENLQLRFKPDGKLEAADEAKIRAFLVETLGCKPQELKFEQYEAKETQGFQRSVYIKLKEKLVASIDGDTAADGNIEFALMKRDLTTGLCALRIEIDAEGRLNRYSHQLIRDGKEEKYGFSRSSGHTHYTATDVQGRDTNNLLEEINLSCDSTGKAKSASRKTSEYGTDYEYYYRDRAAYDEVHKKSQ